MEASKLTLSTEQKIALHNPVLPRKRKEALRVELLFQYIRRHPAGEPLVLREIAHELNFVGKEASNFFNFLGRQIAAKKITMEGGRKTHRRVFTVLEDVKTVVAPKTEAIAKPADNPEPAMQQTAAGTLTDFARQFAWERNSDSLREFVQYMDGKELDLRRMVTGGGDN